MTIREFYSRSLYQDIDEYIGLPKSSYRVVSLALPPIVPLYNGFYTADGYFNIYSKKHRDEMRKAMGREVTKLTNPVLLDNFNGNMNHCQLFSAERGAVWASRKRVPSFGVYLFDGFMTVVDGFGMGGVRQVLFPVLREVFSGRADTLIDRNIRKQRYDYTIESQNAPLSIWR